MSVEITRQSVAANNLVSPVGAEVIHDVQGRYRGEAVRLAPDASSKLANEAEEIGMAIAGRADRRSLGQRDLRAGRGSSPEGLSKTRGSFDIDLPDMPPEAEFASLLDHLASLQERMSSRGEHPTKEEVLAALQDFDGDVTHQFAALDLAREHFEAAGTDAGFLMLLDGAKAEFETGDVGRDVRAGFAVAALASKTAATLETDPATVRDVYRTMLRETMNVGQIFDALGAFDPLKSLGEAVEVFTTAAGRDLASTGPSSDPMFLHSLITELSKLKKVRTTLDATQRLVQVTERSLPAAQRGRMNVADQASRILNFASHPGAGPGDALRMLGSFETAPLATRLVYANGLRDLHGDIPDEVMPSPQARLQQRGAIVSMLDRLVADEEREFTGRVLQ